MAAVDVSSVDKFMLRNADQNLLVVAVLLLITLLGAGCASDDGQSSEQIQQSDRVVEMFTKQRAWLACLQDNGIDAELLPNGVVLPDKNSNLTQEEWRDLSDLCEQRLENEGIVLSEEPSDESRERNYNSWVMFRECMLDQGIDLGELVTFESYVADPDNIVNSVVAAASEDLSAFQEAYDNCPSRLGYFSFNVVDLSE
ncbi:MAG: hypothetical protein KTU85_00865 [Acidimicrobiia bacterium]|nr:hypothetical protein [Acidimicrobiia bacterium]MCY4457259.1 hypothetical protein [Acidimicrobiaceae bacterium]